MLPSSKELGGGHLQERIEDPKSFGHESPAAVGRETREDSMPPTILSSSTGSSGPGGGTDLEGSKTRSPELQRQPCFSDPDC